MAIHHNVTHSPFASPMLHALARGWWLMLLRGIAAIAFGVLAFAWPQKTLLVLVIFYGAYVLLDGIFAIAAAVTGRGSAMQTWWLVVVGLLGIGAGILTFFWPSITALILILLMGAWALVQGIFQIAGAIQLRKEIESVWLLILSGAVSVLFGLVVLMSPGAGALALVWLVAAYAIVFGAFMVAFALQLRRHRAEA